MTRLLASAATLVCLSLTAAGCTTDPEPTATGTASTSSAGEALAPVSLPDLEQFAPSVRRQLSAGHAALAAALAAPSATEVIAQRYGDLGHLLLAATLFDEALLCYRHAESLQPEDMRWPYYRGHAHLRAGDRANAATAFERALTVRPQYVPAVIWLADMYLDTGRADLAQITYGRALAIQPESAVAHFGAGRAALARGAHAEAVTHLEAASRLDPQATAIHYPLAMAYRATGDRERAAALVRRRGSRPPQLDDPLLREADVLLDSAVSHEGLGMQALRRQDWRAAIASFRSGLALAPDDAALRYWLATALLVSGDTAGAEREFRAVVRAQPAFARAHFSLGVIHEQRRELPEARREFEATVEHAPNLPEGHLRLAETLRALGRHDEAVPRYDAAVGLDPGLADAWIGGGRALLSLNRHDAARDWLQRARRLHPDRQELADLAGQVSVR